MSVEGHKAADGENMQAFMNAVSPGYWDALKIPVIGGRDFRASDAKQLDFESPDAQYVAIVNQKFAEHFFKDKSPIGKRLGFGTGPKTNLNIEIVGVVGNALYEGPREGVRRQVFIANYGKNTGVFYLRTQTASSEIYTSIRNEVRKLDAGIPVYEMKTVAGQLDETLLTDRLVAMLSAGFGALATLLAAIGLYGVMAFVVARRNKELGIRLALGAEPGSVVMLVMREVLLLLAIGLAVGIPAAIALGRYVSTQLYGIKPADPWIAIWTVVLLTTVSAAAGLIPARRAGKINPILALRTD